MCNERNRNYTRCLVLEGAANQIAGFTYEMFTLKKFIVYHSPSNEMFTLSKLIITYHRPSNDHTQQSERYK